jgi:hypothetical protein
VDGAELESAGRIAVGLLCAAACAVPAHAQRRLDLGVTGTVLYDSNVARGSKAQAQARGLVQEDVRFMPAATLDMLIPVGRHALFATALAGYDFYAATVRLTGSGSRPVRARTSASPNARPTFSGRWHAGNPSWTTSRWGRSTIARRSARSISRAAVCALPG